MKRLYSAMIAAALVYGCASSPPLQEENCGLQVPPKEAFPVFSDFRFTFIYPAHLPNDYTGCETRWQENGRVYSVTHFKRGKPVEYKSYDDKGSLLVSCAPKKFEYMKIMAPYSRCPAYEGLIPLAGVKSIFKGEVPPERDPRDKGSLPVPDYVIQDLPSALSLLKGDNCDYQTRPEDPIQYPPLENYTGCRILWAHDGYRATVVHFEHGVADVILTYGEDHQFYRACKIKYERVLNGFYCPDHRSFITE